MRTHHILGLSILLIGFIILTNAGLTHAVCGDRDMEKFWVNSDPNTIGITGLNIEFSDCNDTQHGHIPTIGSSGGNTQENRPKAYVRIYRQCTPTNCNLGRKPATFVGFSDQLKQHVRVDVKHVERVSPANYTPKEIVEVVMLRAASNRLLVYTRLWSLTPAPGEPRERHLVEYFTPRVR